MQSPSAAPQWLILFDIDGTILTTGGCGEKALRIAVGECFGGDDHFAGIEIAGRTDTHISRQLHAKYGREYSAEAERVFLERYLYHLAILLPQIDGRLLPGVVKLLEVLGARSDVLLGLLTGNLARGAELKLRHYGVWQYFRCGAYADDHHDRNALGPFAQKRAAQFALNNFAPAQTFVIGDTPHDIACARACGAKAVAVATGNFSVDALAAHQPDLLFADLGDVSAVIQAMQLP